MHDSCMKQLPQNSPSPAVSKMWSAFFVHSILPEILWKEIHHICRNIESSKKGRPQFGNTKTKGILWLLILEFYTWKKCRILFQRSMTTFKIVLLLSFFVGHPVFIAKYIYVDIWRIREGHMKTARKGGGANIFGTKNSENWNKKILIKRILEQK